MFKNDYQVLQELQHYPETWAGMELTPVIAYGFRLYRNGSSLDMHIDKSHTHIISFILHIDSSDDSEPWPILIEDFYGSTFHFCHGSSGIIRWRVCTAGGWTSVLNMFVSSFPSSSSLNYSFMGQILTK